MNNLRVMGSLFIRGLRSVSDERLGRRAVVRLDLDSRSARRNHDAAPSFAQAPAAPACCRTATHLDVPRGIHSRLAWAAGVHWDRALGDRDPSAGRLKGDDSTDYGLNSPKA